MAKGQRRSNREIKKPKKERALPKIEGAFSKQIGTARPAGSSSRKGKS